MSRAPTPLDEKLKRRIARSGPLGVAEYMEICLADPEYGYYRTRDPLGARGDFITAPEISQIFGELIGLWCAEVWRGMGEPGPFQLIELGPGRGTLMADALRAAKAVPDFVQQARLHLVETSPVLRQEQAERLAEHAPQWHDTFTAVPPGPSIVIANEFLDALPVRQFVRRGGGWRERLIAPGGDGALAFVESPGPPDGDPRIPLDIATGAQPGDIAEIRPAANALAAEFGRRAADHPLAVLIVDYGHVQSAPGDTLQAMSAHGYTDPLERPGDQDLTAHVDFAEFARRAEESGLRTHGPLEQGQFLLALGLAHRADRLMKGAGKEQAALIETAARRLADPAQMGALFKVLAATDTNGPAPPPFPATSQEPTQGVIC